MKDCSQPFLAVLCRWPPDDKPCEPAWAFKRGPAGFLLRPIRRVRRSGSCEYQIGKDLATMCPCDKSAVRILGIVLSGVLCFLSAACGNSPPAPSESLSWHVTPGAAESTSAAEVTAASTSSGQSEDADRIETTTGNRRPLPPAAPHRLVETPPSIGRPPLPGPSPRPPPRITPPSPFSPWPMQPCCPR